MTRAARCYGDLKRVPVDYLNVLSALVVLIERVSGGRSRPYLPSLEDNLEQSNLSPAERDRASSFP